MGEAQLMRFEVVFRRCQCKLRPICPESSFAEKDVQVPEYEKFSLNLQCALAAKAANCIPGYIGKNTGSSRGK